MTQPPVSLSQHLLTRSDLAKLGIPAGRILTWLGNGWLDQVGSLPGAQPHGDPVFAVLTRELRNELAARLLELGKDTVVFSPLRVRSLLMRSLLLEQHGKAAPRETPVPVVAEPPEADPVTAALQDPDVADALRKAANDLVREVDTVLELAREEARLEAIEQAAEAAANSLGDPMEDHFSDAHDAEPRGTRDVDFFDVDDLAEELGVWTEDETAAVSVDATLAKNAPTADAPPSHQEAVPGADLAEENPTAESPVAEEEATIEEVVSTRVDENDVLSAEPQTSAVEEVAASETSVIDEEAHDDQTLTAIEDVTSTEEVTAEALQAAIIDQRDEPAVVAEIAAPAQPFSDLAPTESVVPKNLQAEPEPNTEGEALVADSALEMTPGGEKPPNQATEASELDDLLNDPPPSTTTAAEVAVAQEVAFEEPSAVDPAAVEQAQTEPSEVPASQPEEETHAEPQQPMVAASSDAAMQRVESFLGELRGVLVELASRPQAPTIDVQPLVAAVQQGFTQAKDQTLATDTALASLTNRIGDFGDKVEHGVALAVHAALGSKTTAAPAPAMAAPTAFVVPSQDRTTLALLAIGFLVLCWTVVFWFKTGNPRLALGTLIGANVIGCCLLVGRRNN